MAGGGLVSGKKQREVYVGNLTIGAVTDNMLRELFNGALAHLVIDPVTNPAVVNASLDPSGARLCPTACRGCPVAMSPAWCCKPLSIDVFQ